MDAVLEVYPQQVAIRRSDGMCVAEQRLFNRREPGSSASAQLDTALLKGGRPISPDRCPAPSLLQQARRSNIDME